MKYITTVLCLGAFLVFIGMPDEILAQRRPTTPIPPPGPNEEYLECGTWCERTCAKPQADQGPCILMCKRGNFCVDGYVRESENGLCILPSECRQRVIRRRQ